MAQLVEQQNFLLSPTKPKQNGFSSFSLGARYRTLVTMGSACETDSDAVDPVIVETSTPPQTYLKVGEKERNLECQDLNPEHYQRGPRDSWTWAVPKKKKVRNNRAEGDLYQQVQSLNVTS